MRHLSSLLLLAVILLAALAVEPVRAVEPGEMLKDPKLEARARKISQGLRCLVCQNENIDESNAPLARDLRILLRERLKAGDTDQQAIDYIVSRYGEYVLLKPRLGLHTLLLWAGPFLLLLFGAVLLWRKRRSVAARPAQTEGALSEEERQRLRQLLEE